ncbi:hypothetical protein F5B20DRAFT_348982 [Whalleya microplaca]|nr:hypothetical protein F5B20DRAFT_348982 [Whalleya microplaca]
MSPSATSSNASALPHPILSPSSVPESPGMGPSVLALNNNHAAGPSSNISSVSPPLSSPSFPSAAASASSSRQAAVLSSSPNNTPSGPRSSSISMMAASPPKGGATVASTSATAGGSNSTSGSAAAVVMPQQTQPQPQQQVNATQLPSRTTQLHISEARAALVASVSNMVDSELQSRASVMHANAGVLARQGRDVERATDALRKENDKLEKMARDAGRKIKEIGNVQNWAEVLERDFLVLEETMRLVRSGGDSESGSGSCSQCSGSGSSWSGSDTAGSRVGSTSSSRRPSVVDDGEHQQRSGGPVASANLGADTVAAAKKNHEPPVVGGGGRDSDGDVTMDGTGSTTTRPEPTPSISTGTTVVVDEALAASISEAMATYVGEAMNTTGMHDAPNPLDLGVHPAGHASPAKGKEPAVEHDRMEIDAAEVGSRELQQTSGASTVNQVSD